ncbi:MAG: LLM class flavin-dependent oxidoreductase [Nitrososphaerota archaeon]
MVSRFKLGLDVSFWMDDKYSMPFLRACEKAGFDSLWFGDHIYPWHHSFKHSFFVWSVLAAAAERTRRIPLGVDVTVPIGGRYHPAIVAQAVGTLSSMYPGRIYLGVGSGEAINEERFLGYWPSWKERIERLAEAVSFIRRLFKEQIPFDFNGKYFKMSKAFLYVKPKGHVPIFFSAGGPKAATYAGMYGDHLMTYGTVERCRDFIFPAFEQAARESNKDVRRMEKVVLIEGALGDAKAAIKKIRKYHAGTLIAENFNEPDPMKIEDSAKQITDEQILQNYYISRKADGLIDVIDRYRKIGTTHLIFTDFSASPERTILAFSKEIIPYFRDI